ncbi:MAG: YraN family protein [Alphaproteobacteria bacterium]
MHIHTKGWLAEWATVAYLSLCGYRIVRRNSQIAGVEVDILAKKADQLVVVEVKWRKTWDGADMAITPTQRKRLQKAMNAIASKAYTDTVRLDVVYWVAQWPFVRHVQDA